MGQGHLDRSMISNFVKSEVWLNMTLYLNLQHSCERGEADRDELGRVRAVVRVHQVHRGQPEVSCNEGVLATCK